MFRFMSKCLVVSFKLVSVDLRFSIIALTNKNWHRNSTHSCLVIALDRSLINVKTNMAPQLVSMDCEIDHKDNNYYNSAIFNVSLLQYVAYGMGKYYFY